MTDENNQKELLKRDEKKRSLIPELAASGWLFGLLTIAGQTLVSFIAWAVYEQCWERFKAWWQKRKKQS